MLLPGAVGNLVTLLAMATNPSSPYISRNRPCPISDERGSTVSTSTDMAAVWVNSRGSGLRAPNRAETAAAERYVPETMTNVVAINMKMVSKLSTTSKMTPRRFLVRRSIGSPSLTACRSLASKSPVRASGKIRVTHVTRRAEKVTKLLFSLPCY